MTKPSPPGRPRPDRADDAMFAYAESLLDDFFSDPENRHTHERLALDSGKAGETVAIGPVEQSDRGTSGLVLRSGSREITVSITHPRFNATIAARYDLNAAAMTHSRMVQFDGDRAKAAKCADRWFEELADTLFDDDDDDELDNARTALREDDELPFDGVDDPGEPPPPSARDKAMVEGLAKALAREMKRKNAELLAHQDGLLALVLLLAPRARAATDRAHKERGNDLIVLAHSLCGERELATIPLMAAIARHTVEVARMARW